jgi:hypothetical protein
MLFGIAFDAASVAVATTFDNVVAESVRGAVVDRWWASLVLLIFNASLALLTRPENSTVNNKFNLV